MVEVRHSVRTLCQCVASLDNKNWLLGVGLKLSLMTSPESVDIIHA